MVVIGDPRHRHRPSAAAKIRMLPVPRKFNIFNTFNTFNTFDFFAVTKLGRGMPRPRYTFRQLPIVERHMRLSTSRRCRSSSMTSAAGNTHPNLRANFFSTAACRSGMYEETASEMIVVR